MTVHLLSHPLAAALAKASKHSTMILVSETEIHSAKALMSDGQTIDPPPMYVASLPPQHPAPEAQSPQTRPSPKPTNYVCINREHESIKGHFVIDPFLNVPLPLLPPLAGGESEDDRMNVKLESKHGAIDVGISLLDDVQDPSIEEAKRKRPTTLDIKSVHGSINVKLRTCPSPSSTSIPFHLNVTNCHGSITVWLPRTFRGPMTINSKHGAVKFSDDILEHMGLCNEVDHIRRCFIGDVSLFSDEGGGWKGDEVNIQTKHSKVKVRFVDEVETPNGKPGFLSRMFGVF